MGNNKRRFLGKICHFLNKTSLANQLFTELTQRLLETLSPHNPQTSHQLPYQMLQSRFQPFSCSIIQVKIKIIEQCLFFLNYFKAKPKQIPREDVLVIKMGDTPAFPHAYCPVLARAIQRHYTHGSSTEKQIYAPTFPPVPPSVNSVSTIKP